jgi:hypothetical protein
MPTVEALVCLPLMIHEPSGHRALMTYRPLGLRRIYGPRIPSKQITHDLSGLALRSQTAGRAQHNKPHQAKGYEGQGLA